MAQEDYDNLNAELATGERLATELVHHLKRMGNASAASIPITVDGEKYVICIEHSSIGEVKSLN